MPKARKRKDTQFDNKISKCVFLYGEPTNDKAEKSKGCRRNSQNLSTGT